MPWSEAFVAELRKPTIAPVYILRTTGVLGSDNDTPGGSWSVSSSALYGDGSMIVEQSSIQGQRLTAQTWDSAIGGLSVAIAKRSYQQLLGAFSRGQLVELLVGFVGWDLADFAPVWRGMTVTMTGVGPVRVIQCRDILGALGTRITQSSSNLALFDGVGSTSASAAAYTAGSTTLRVSSTANFERQDDGTGTLRGLLRVDGTNGGTSVSFYRYWTSASATEFTVNPDATFLGTTDSSCTTFTATEYVYLDDHPLDAARRVLVSTGTAGANGDYDWLPAKWGYGIPDAWIDHDDTDYHVAASQPQTGDDDWHIFTATAQSDGLSWLISVLQPGGFFLTLRQGQITGRCVMDPTNVGIRVAAAITDDEIVSIDDWDGWDSQDYQTECANVTYTTDSTTASDHEAIGSLPAVTTETVDLSAMVYANEDAIRDEVAGRLSVWRQRIPERLSITVRPMVYAGLAVGDVVELTTDQHSGRLETTADGYRARRAYVVEVDADWFSLSVRLTLLILPTYAESVYAGAGA